MYGSDDIISNRNILVTPRSLTRTGHQSLIRLQSSGYQTVMCQPGQQPSTRELLELLPDCVGYLAGVEPIDKHVLTAATRLQVISRNGTGVNNIDLDAAKRLGISVLRAEGANARGVAELTIGLVFSLVREIPFSNRQLKQLCWERRKGIELDGRTLGLVGCGRVGQHVAVMATGMGMRVCAYDPYAGNASLTTTPPIRFESLANVLGQSDVVSLHCPPSPEGHPLINADSLGLMKDGAYLVNTARGELLDDQAVLDALNCDKLSGLAIDAYRREPPGNALLIQHHKVIATPHIGAFTSESVSRACDAAVDNLLEFLGPARTLEENSP